MAESRRVDRIARLLRAELAAIIEADIDDPRIGGVTLTRVRLSSDLGHATVYVHSIDDAAKRRAQLNGLNSARGFLRRQLSRRLGHLKRTPELRFEFDAAVEAGMRVEELLGRIEGGEAGNDEPEGS